MDRRGFMAVILAASSAPAIVKAGSIMRINPRILAPATTVYGSYGDVYDTGLPWTERFWADAGCSIPARPGNLVRGVTYTQCLEGKLQSKQLPVLGPSYLTNDGTLKVTVDSSNLYTYAYGLL